MEIQFKISKNIKRKFEILLDAFWGYILKFKIDIFGIGDIQKLSEQEDKIIVSLTSYGRRVSKTIVFYTLVSLLKQKKKPSKIILWLDNSWTNDTIPSRIKKLQKLGVEINFCEDIKSYKKLIPTLTNYPDHVIVTVDDDIYYNPSLLQTLWNGYKKNGKIQCTVAKIPNINKNKEFGSYNDWIEVSKECDNSHIVPIGAGGILYPINSLSSEVFRINDFMELAPNADDLWFWVMAKRIYSQHSVSEMNKSNYSFDALYQYFHKGSALTHTNAGEAQNDIQLNNILKKYPIDF